MYRWVGHCRCHPQEWTLCLTQSWPFSYPTAPVSPFRLPLSCPHLMYQNTCKFQDDGHVFPGGLDSMLQAGSSFWLGFWLSENLLSKKTSAFCLTFPRASLRQLAGQHLDFCTCMIGENLYLYEFEHLLCLRTIVFIFLFIVNSCPLRIFLFSFFFFLIFRSSIKFRKLALW